MKKWLIFCLFLPVIFTLSCTWHGVKKKATAVGWGGRAVAVSVNPDDPNKVWVVSPTGGLFKSSRGGEEWEHVDAMPESGCFCVKVCPSDPQTIVVSCIEDTKTVNGGGIWVSKDGGNTWTHPVTSIVNSPNGEARRYSAYGISFMPGTNNVIVGTDSALAVSNDLGTTWHFVNPQEDGLKNAIYSVLGLSNGEVVTSGERGIWISENALTNWFRDETNLNVRANIHNALAVSFINNNHLFYTGGYNRLYYSIDGGHHWQKTDADFKSISGSYSASRQTFVKAVRASANSTNSVELYYSSLSLVCKKTIIWTGTDYDFSATWTPLNFKHSDPSDLEFTANGIQPIYATNDGGVEKSNNGGVTWFKSGRAENGFDAFQIYDVKAVVTDVNYNYDVYFGTQDNNVYASIDGGKTYPIFGVTEGGTFQCPAMKSEIGYLTSLLKNKYTITHYNPIHGHLASVRNFVNTIHIAFPFNAPEAVYYVPKGSPPWMNGTFAAFSTDEKLEFGLYISENGCITWSSDPVAKADLIPNLYSFIAGSLTNPSVITPYMVGIKHGLFRVDNAFNNVMNDEVVTPIPLPQNAIIGTYGFQWRSTIASYGVDPKNPNYIILPDIANNKIFITSNGGNTWVQRDDLLKLITENGKYRFSLSESSRENWELSTSQVTAIAFDPLNSDKIIIGTTESGIVYSSDHGNSWRKIIGSDKIPNITSLTFIRTNGAGEAIASSWGRGLWSVCLDVGSTRSEAGMLAISAFAQQERKENSTIVPGDKKHAYEIFNDTLSPVVVIIEDSTQKFLRNVVINTKAKIFGKRWSPALPLIFNLDGEKFDPTNLIRNDDGTFVADLPIFETPEKHTLVVSQFDVENKQIKEAIRSFYVIISDEKENTK